MQTYRQIIGRTTSHSRDSRAGLAPLELTLSLPIMLFVMALTVIVGTSASWKVRAVANARHSVWRQLTPRTGGEDPFPRNWPANDATLDIAEGQSPLPVDPYREFEVVRGQPLTGQGGTRLEVRQSLFQMDDALDIGLAAIDRKYPMLGNLPARPGQTEAGRLQMQREHPLLDDRWQFGDMGLPSNTERRVLFLYPEDLERALSAEINRYHTAALAIVTSPDNGILDTLDADADLRNHEPGGLTYQPPYGIDQSPDYYLPTGQIRRVLLNPSLVCSDNPNRIRENVVLPLLPEIDPGVSQRLTRDHLRMYEQWVAHIDRLLAILRDPTAERSLKAQIQPFAGQMQRDKARLEPLIEQLQEFSGNI